jgi:pilus assembly protein Flp/PilA
MNNFKQILSNLLEEESGQDLVEYALVAALIGLGATATISTVATTIRAALSTLATKLTAAV